MMRYVEMSSIAFIILVEATNPIHRDIGFVDYMGLENKLINEIKHAITTP